MNLEEFSNLKQNLVQLVLEFEGLEKKRYLLNNAYFIEFHEHLEQQRHIQYENEYLSKAIAMHVDGRAEEEVKQYLEQSKKDFLTYMNSFHRQYSNALAMEKQCSSYTQKDLDQLDQTFVEYCSNYHPLVHPHSTPNEQMIYSTLISLYRANNFLGFKNLLKESEALFTSPVVEEAEIDTVGKFYQESIKRLKDLIQKAKNAFPLNRESIFYQKELLTREEIYLREKNYKDRDINKALQEDFKLHFSFMFSL